MVEAYKINRFYTDKLSGSCLVEVSYGTKNGKRAFLHPFSSADIAATYIDGEARDWFMGVLEDYVHHKKHIIKEDNREQFGELTICLNALQSFEGKAIQTLAERFIKGYTHFMAILPNPNNDSHQSSVNALKQLKDFAESFLKYKQINL